MNTHDPQNHTRHHDTEQDPRPHLARRIRLVSRLMRAEMHRALPTEQAPTRSEVKAAARAVEDRAAEALSPEELATVLAALDKIADAFGGRDALPYREHRGHRGFGPRGFGRGGFGRGGERGFGPHHLRQGHPRY